MVDAFIHCYETEMKQWSGREKPHLSGKKYNFTLLAFGYEPLASLYASGLLTSLQKALSNIAENIHSIRNL